ncbi:MAG TPA: hypothetical protein VF601_10905 [Beijerinckiaceae bacterium]|jgi:hypothetical protein
MRTADLDKLHDERINVLEARVNETGEFDIEEIFVSERVIETLPEEKFLLPSYSLPRILSVMPFCPVTYVAVCPMCLEEKDLANFTRLLESQRVVPVLTAKYKRYPDLVRETVTRFQHISLYEYWFFRTCRILTFAEHGICPHCVDKRLQDIAVKVNGRKNAPLYMEECEEIRSNLSPLINPDSELLDAAAKACSSRRLGQVRHLRQMSETIHKIRTAQAFNAPLSLDEDDLSELPQGLSESMDKTVDLSLGLKKLVAEGLGLCVPLDLPVEAYLEIVEDYQPQISRIVQQTLAGGAHEASIDVVSKNIQQINAEILRIKGLKKYVLLEASIGFYRNHRALVNTTLLAGAMGLTGGLTACAGAIVAASAGKIAKRKGWLKNNKAAQRFGQMIVRDLQPHMDRVLASYVGGTLPAVNVLSIRRTFENRRNNNQS